MDTGFEAKLIESLDAVERGEPIAQILLRYPQETNQLRPILETARQLSELKLAPSASAKRASKNEFLDEARQMRQSTQLGRKAGTVFRSLNRLLATVALLLVIGVVGVVGLSNSALPGEGLYGVKVVLEQVRLSLAQDPQSVAALNEEFEAKRLAEVQRLLAVGVEIEVVFGDDILTLREEKWGLVSGVQIQLDEKTVVVGKPEVGVYAHIVGKTTSAGTVLASFLQIEPAHNNPDHIPAATDLPQPTLTLTPSPTATPSPTHPTATPTPTQTILPPTLTSSPSPGPTTTSGSTPTFPATPDHTGNDSADDGGISGSGGDDGTDDNSGSDSGNDSSDDNSGSGSEDDDDSEDDNSGSGSGSDDDSSDDNSGSGSEDDDDSEDDNSGSGGGDDNDDDEDEDSGFMITNRKLLA